MRALFLFVVGISLSFYWTLVEKVLYDWFIFPIINFPLSYWQIYGAGLFWGLFTFKYSDFDIEDDELLKRYISSSISAPLYMVSLGYIVKTFII